MKYPSWYTAPTPTGSPRRNRSPVLGEVGPSRSPAVHPSTRHQPYPQSRPEQQGLYTIHSPIRGHVKGKNREIPSTAMGHDLSTPSTSSLGGCLTVRSSALKYCASSNTVCKPAPPITRLYNRTLVESPQNPSPSPQYSRSQRAAAETLTPAQWTPAPRYPIDATVPGKFRRLPAAQEHIPPINSTRGSQGPIPTSHTRPTHPRTHQQLRAIVTGSCGPAMTLPTPPMGANSLPDGSPRRPLADKRSPWRLNQERRPESLTPPTAGTPSPRYPAQQLVPHPYPRPANVRQ